MSERERGSESGRERESKRERERERGCRGDRVMVLRLTWFERHIVGKRREEPCEGRLPASLRPVGLETA